MDLTHHPRGGNSTLFQFSSNYREILNFPKAWNPYQQMLDWNNLGYKVDIKDNQMIYEVSIRADEGLDTNETLGLDLIVVDQDSVNTSNSNSIFYEVSYIKLRNILI